MAGILAAGAPIRAHSRFCKVSRATVVENHPHDILITKESPNYMVGKNG